MRHEKKHVPHNAREEARQLKFDSNPANFPDGHQPNRTQFGNREGNIPNKDQRGNVQFREADVQSRGYGSSPTGRGQNRVVIKVRCNGKGKPIKYDGSYFSNSHYGNGADAKRKPAFQRFNR